MGTRAVLAMCLLLGAVAVLLLPWFVFQAASAFMAWVW
jgi:hypothetical protein